MGFDFERDYGVNAGYVQALYEEWRAAPDDVEEPTAEPEDTVEETVRPKAKRKRSEACARASFYEKSCFFTNRYCD